MSALRARTSADWRSEAAGGGAVALLLHGYGSDEHDLVDLVPALGIPLPWASLRAPLEMPFGGAAWFPLPSLQVLDTAAVEAATGAVWAWVDANVDPAAHIVPIGFSQGGLMTIQLLRTRPERVLAPVVLAGFLLDAAQPGDVRLEQERPAVFWGRGAADDRIDPEAVARLAAFLPRHATCTERVYPGLGHGIDAAELVDVRAFLRAHLGQGTLPGD
jgi:phospholipase/carboxylesterase